MDGSKEESFRYVSISSLSSKNQETTFETPLHLVWLVGLGVYPGVNEGGLTFANFAEYGFCLSVPP